MKKHKKILGIPSVDLPDFHIIVISVIFILIFPLSAIIASIIVDKKNEPATISTMVTTKEVVVEEAPAEGECNMVEPE